MSYETRISKVQAALAGAQVDALLVTSLTNVRYLTGFSGSNGQVLLTASQAHFFSDPRYEQRALSLVEGAEVHIYSGRLSETSWQGPPAEALKLLTVSSVQRLGIEASTMSVAERDSLASVMEGTEIVATEGMVEVLRKVKDAQEIDAIRRAVAVADRAFTEILGELQPGRKERDIALSLEMIMRNSGAEDASFEPIVGSGPLSAHIHHTPGERELAKGDLVLMDFGALVDGYCSDMTRTVVLGAATDEQREIYDLVRRAQQAGIDALGPGTSGRAVDAAARKVIEDAGFGERFAHGLGHGVGLAIHEDPRLSKTSEDVIAVGEVITVEPGVYIPGSGGVRIEDCVLVTDQGAEVLGSSPKDDLIEL